MTVTFRGSLTPAICRRVLSARMRVMQWIVGIWIVAAIIALIYGQVSGTISWAGPVGVMVGGAIVLASPWLTARRTFATDRLAGEEQTGEADEQGVRISTPHGRADLPWSTVYKAVLLHDAVVIYQSTQILRIVPRAFFADDVTWQSFRELVRLSVPGRTRKQAGVGTFMLVLLAFVLVFMLYLWTQP